MGAGKSRGPVDRGITVINDGRPAATSSERPSEPAVRVIPADSSVRVARVCLLFYPAFDCFRALAMTWYFGPALVSDRARGATCIGPRRFRAATVAFSCPRSFTSIRRYDICQSNSCAAKQLCSGQVPGPHGLWPIESAIHKGTWS